MESTDSGLVGKGVSVRIKLPPEEIQEIVWMLEGNLISVNTALEMLETLQTKQDLSEAAGYSSQALKAATP